MATEARQTPARPLGLVALAARRARGDETTLGRMLRSTAFRLTALTIAVLGIAAAAIVAAVGWSVSRDLIASTEAAIARDVGDLKRHYAAGGLDALAAAVTDRSRGEGPTLYFLGPRDGARRAGNLTRLPPSLAEPNAGSTFRYPTKAGNPHTAAGALIELDNGLVLLVARDIEEQRALLAAMRRGLTWGLGALTLVGVAGGLLVARHILGRIDAISTASRTIMAGDLTRRLPLAGTDDELDRLSSQLNAMLGRIEQLMAGLREVSDNIAHDLKTPLNRLRNRAETALADARGGPAWRDGLERTITDADELIKTFNALLLIARLEAGAVEEAGTIVDARHIAAEVADLYEPMAEDAGFSLIVRAEHSAPVRANAQLLAQALSNLIENAIKYSRAAGGKAAVAGDITIAVREAGNFVELAVGDRGPGIAPADRERALKRFGRLDASRSQPGTGLGLSLVAAVARMHGGTVRLDDNRPGLLVVLSLPRAR